MERNIKNLNATKTTISRLELAALGEEEKTRLNEIICHR